MTSHNLDTPSSVNARNSAAPRIERAIGTLLRVGVITSLVIIVLGTAVSFAHHESYVRSQRELYRLTEPGTKVPQTIPEILQGLRNLRGQAIVSLGLLFLIATPVMRVLLSVLLFVAQKDRLFTLITATVLSLLILSFVVGKVG